MRILVVGGGGREHAIIKKLKENKSVEVIYALPGNGGIARDAVCVPIGATDIAKIVDFAVENKIDYAVVAPDDPLVLGAVDALEEKGIPTHYVKELNDRDTLVKHVKIVPLEVIVRNIAAGSLSKRLGLPEGTKLKTTVLEYCYKNDDLGDPMINDYHIAAMELATKDEMAQIAAMALKVNELLTAYLKDLGIELIDFKLEFGRFNGEILLADEISPDTCRFWDSKTGEKLDKDRFRRDLGHVEDAYQEILRRLMGGHEE